MRILLINPPPARIRESLHDTPEYPHLGLGSLAGWLRKHKIKVKVIDAKLLRWNRSRVLKEAVKFKPELIGITSRTVEIKSASRLAGNLKKQIPEVPILIGGAQATGDPIGTLKKYKSFSGAVIGEGEMTLLEVARALRGGKWLDSIDGLAWRIGNDIVVGGDRDLIQNLDEIPEPAWDLFPRSRRYYMIATRGCPYRCITCLRLLGGGVRKRSPEHVVNELENLVSLGAEEIEFADESFTVDSNYVKEICALIIERKLNSRVKWIAQTRVDLVDPDMLKLMRKAGCERVIVGAESGDETVLRNAHKGIKPYMTVKAINMIRNAGFITDANFMLGLPGETLITALKTLRFMIRLNPDSFSLSIAVPYPGTRLRTLAMAGFGGLSLISDNPDDYNNQLGGAMELDRLPRWALELLQLAGYSGVFLLNGRFFEFMEFVLKHRRDALSFLENLLFKKAG